MAISAGIATNVLRVTLGWNGYSSKTTRRSTYC